MAFHSVILCHCEQTEGLRTKFRSDEAIFCTTQFFRLLHLRFAMTNFERATTTLAPIAATSFCAAERSKRYSGKREIALKKERKLKDGGRKFTIIEK
ncbi:hypothetical protein [Chryseobacterium taeanense]|uniref:hypothetical protein n=1 Tax=Chryseobacterium taeanense TaxID=311334 RepID=UPI000B7C7CDE|nr:hypothetical protein [Chryseobacterium taeanense]